MTRLLAWLGFPTITDELLDAIEAYLADVAAATR